MDISELLADGAVVLRSGASSKRQALHTVAEAAAHALGLPKTGFWRPCSSARPWARPAWVPASRFRTRDWTASTG
jgi:hypothetical protein